MIDYRVAVEIPPDNLQFAKEISRANIASIVFQKYRKVNPNPQKKLVLIPQAPCFVPLLSIFR